MRKALIRILMTAAGRKRTKHIVIDGSVAPSKRQGLVNDFQGDSRVKVALLSIQAAGVGLTLTVRPVVPGKRRDTAQVRCLLPLCDLFLAWTTRPVLCDKKLLAYCK